MNTLIPSLRKELSQNSSEETRVSGRRFFKEKIKLYGVKTPLVQKIAARHFQAIKEKTRPEIFPLCETLFQSGYLEEFFIACCWAENLHKQYTPEDFQTFSRWVHHYITNWSACDTLCNHTIGSFVETFPRYVKELKKWTASQNRWVRRAAAVSLILPARKGLFLDEVFAICTSLLADPDDLVQKGYGWLLKDASRRHPKEVFAFVMRHKNTMPRTALRYAVEKMPDTLRRKAMEKH